jgi:hypothetical protein
MRHFGYLAPLLPYFISAGGKSRIGGEARIWPRTPPINSDDMVIDCGDEPSTTHHS